MGWMGKIKQEIKWKKYWSRSKQYFCIYSWICKLNQGCVLRKITRSPKVPNYVIQGAQHKAYMKELRLSGHPKAKVSHLRHPGTLWAQPCKWVIPQYYGQKKLKFKVVYLTQIPDKLIAYKLYFMKMVNNFCRQLLFVHKLSLITIDSENCCCGGESYMFCW